MDYPPLPGTHRQWCHRGGGAGDVTTYSVFGKTVQVRRRWFIDELIARLEQIACRDWPIAAILTRAVEIAGAYVAAQERPPTLNADIRSTNRLKTLRFAATRQRS